MQCPHCNEVVQDESYKFCVRCGWNLSMPAPDPKEAVLTIPRVCPECGSTALENFTRPSVCPACGIYIGFNRAILNPELIEKARGWVGRDFEFYTTVLNLQTRAAHALCQVGIKPLEALALNEDIALAIKGFGDKSYRDLDRFRNNWKPEVK